VRFFNIDQHISVIADVKAQLRALGHEVDDLCLSGHHWVMKRPKDSVPGLDGDSWCGFVEREFWNEFYDAWAERLETYDGFICTYPPIFAYLYKRFDKPIIVDIPIRYEYPCQSDAAAWRAFNDYLRDGVDAGRIFLVANNPYDREYAELFLQRTVRYIPSICEYTGARWNPQIDSSLYYCWSDVAGLSDNLLRRYKAFSGRHEWEDLGKFKSIVHFPYNCSTMSIIEQYTMGVPLIFPALDFAVRAYAKKARLFEQLTWCGTFGRAPGSVIEPDGGWGDAPDPNRFDDPEALRYWLRFADFYSEESMQGVSYFESTAELNDIARRPLDWFKARAWDQNHYLERRKARAVDGWTRLMEEIRLCRPGH
jgi:hypothetical protein